MTLFNKVCMPLVERLGPHPLKTIVYLLIPIILLLVVFPSATQPGQVLITDYHDTMSVMMPNLFLMHNPFALWNNMWLAGYSDISGVYSDRFYPFSSIISFFAQNIFVVNFIILLHLYIAFLAFYKLGSIVVKNQDLLFLFALGYMFSGGLISKVFAGHLVYVYALAWAPLLYYFALKILTFNEETTLNIVGLAICELLVFVAGGTYYFFYINAILGIFFLYYVIQKKMHRSTVIALTISALICILMSAIKLIPNIVGMPYVQRLEDINPLGDGGSLFNNFASFIFGTPSNTVWSWWESVALIGAIPVLLVIVAIIWGRRDIVVPAFYAIVFSLIWADGGRILLSFIHVMPFVNNFRCAERIFAAIIPIVLLLSLYGAYIISQKLKNSESFVLNPQQKRDIKFGVAILAIIVVLELPWFSVPSLEAALATIMIFSFILMIYLGKATNRTLILFFSIMFCINAVVILFTINTNGIYNNDMLNKVTILAILVGTTLAFNRGIFSLTQLKTNPFKVWEILVLFSILLLICVNTGVFKDSDPHFSTSPAIGIVDKIKEYPVDNPQIWIYNTGWQPYYYIDFTYHFILNGYHPMVAYYGYVPKTMPPVAVKIGDVDYYLADYIVDTAYLKNGKQNLLNTTFTVDNISVFKPENVLSNAFVFRGDRLVEATFEKYSPDEIIIVGQFQPGDIAVLKAAFYPGWKINGQDSGMIGNMPASDLKVATTRIVFRFDPIEVKIGAVLSAIGIIFIVIVILKRNRLDTYLDSLKVHAEIKKSKKGRGK